MHRKHRFCVALNDANLMPSCEPDPPYLYCIADWLAGVHLLCHGQLVQAAQVIETSSLLGYDLASED